MRGQIALSESQLKVIKDKYLRDAPSVEAWLDGVARNIALGELLCDPRAESWGLFSGVNSKPDGGMRLFHEGLNEASAREANFAKLLSNLEKAARENPEARAVVERWSEAFYRLMSAWDFLPNSPTLMNAGRELQQLSACYVLPVPDSMEGITKALAAQSLIQKSGGGCVGAGAFVHTTFCGLERIETLYRRLQERVPEINEGDRLGLDITGLGIKTLAMDPTSGKLTPSAISHIWRYRVDTQSQIRVRCDNGAAVSTSAWHPFFVFTGTALEERRADQLKPGDAIACINESVSEKWPCVGYREIAGRPLDEDLAWLLAFFLGDGSLGWITIMRSSGKPKTLLRARLFDGRPETLRKVLRIWQSHFGISVSAISKDRRGQCLAITTTDRRFTEWIRIAAGLEPGEKANLRLPQEIGKSPIPVIAAFLAGLVDSDGTVDLKRDRISVTTICEPLASQLFQLCDLLALRPGMMARQPYGKGRRTCFEIRLAVEGQFTRLRHWLLPHVADPIKRTRLERVLAKRDHQVARRLPLAMEPFEDLLEAAGISTHKTSIHRKACVVSGERFWLSNWRIGKGIAADQLLRLCGALRKALPDRFHARLDLIARVAPGLAVISSVERASEGVDFYDFTVPGVQNYLAGENRFIVVHNTGFSFSRLRPKGDPVRRTRGVASGALSFMRLYDNMTEVVKQGGTRRGANMGILHYTHPEIREFIKLKSQPGEMENFNLSVSVDAAFFAAVDADAEYELINPSSGKPVGGARAKEVFELIVEQAWRTGDPGLIFIDRINDSLSNPTPALGQIESTNPCGEQPLLPWEPCNLGSINLSNFVSGKLGEGELDFERLGDAVATAMRFLDDVIEMSDAPLPEIERMAKGNRRVGLGVMGWAEALVKLGLEYDSPTALKLAERVMGFIDEKALAASEALASERGVFPNWSCSVYDPGSPHFRGKESRPRNAARTTIAPTGTIAIAAGLQGAGIEPFFGVAYTRYNARALDALKRGQEPSHEDCFFEVNPLFREWAAREGFFGLSEPALWRLIDANGKSVRGLKEVPERLQKLFATSHDLSAEAHVRVQAAFQRHTDNGVSKTINLPHSATIEDVRRAYRLADQLGCKGITVYRDGSKAQQVLSLAPSPSRSRRRETDAEAAASDYHLIKTGYGPLHVHINYDERGPFQVFLNLPPLGTEISALASVLGIVLSKYLAEGGDPVRILKHLMSVKGDRPYGFGEGRVDSVAHAVAIALRRHLQKNGWLEPGSAPAAVELAAGPRPEHCPKCYSANVRFESGCSGPTCRDCGYSECS